MTALLQQACDRVNAELDAEAEASGRGLPGAAKELDPEAGDEVTSTNKVRRRQLAVKFAALIDEMYDDAGRPAAPAMLEGRAG